MFRGSLNRLTAVNSRSLLIIASLALVALFVAACGSSESDRDSGTSSTTLCTELTEQSNASIEEASPSDWPFPNYDAIGSRATFQSGISSANVTDLKEAWTYELPAEAIFGAAATTPVIVDGTVYLGDLLTNVHAVELETGNARWVVEVGRAVFGPSGVTVRDGCVYGNRGGEEIVAYNASSGEELWATNIVAAGGQVNIQPTTVGNLVLAATSALSDAGARGTLFALNAANGDIVWSFDTIESEDLWGNVELNSGGGAWFPPAIDTEEGISFWGTSNPYPLPGAEGFQNGSSRPGDNRWTDSILAIDTASGELRWGYQAVPHDIFDRDTVLTGVVTVDESGRKVVVNTGKMGRVIGFDLDGNVLWDTPIGRHENDDVQSLEGALKVLPGTTGGVVTPIAIADGVVFVSTVNAASNYTGPDQPLSGFLTDLGTINSQLVAIDALTGQILWDIELPGDGFGGATVVNDLVFTSVFSGQILAYDRGTGDLVWSYDAPGGINGWPAFVDDMLIIPVGFADPPVLLALQP